MIQSEMGQRGAAMNRNDRQPEQFPDSTPELKRIRAAVRRSHEGIPGRLRMQYGLSITRERAHPVMQRLTDLFSAGSGIYGGRARRLRGPGIAGRLAGRNRRMNAAHRPIQGYAGRQGGGGSCDRLRFGLFRMKTNGCEVMAVYNALRYLGYGTDIRDIAYSFEMNGSLLLGGFGVRPDAIADYLEEKTGAEVTSLGPFLYREYDRRFAGAGAAVFTFWNGPGRWTIHTVMIRRLRSGRIRVYNMFPSRLYADFDSISALLSGCGSGLIPISLILVHSEPFRGQHRITVT